MAERYHKRQAADKEHVRYCKERTMFADVERGPLRWWNFVTQRQLAGLHIDRTNTVPYGMIIAEFEKSRNNPKANDIKHPPHGHCVLCIK
jgi:hypothetical protein